jgi:uncharacterized protein DUF4352
MTPIRHTTRKRAKLAARHCALVALTAFATVLLSSCGGTSNAGPTATVRPSSGAAPTATISVATATPTTPSQVAAAAPTATASVAPAPQAATAASSPTPIPSPAAGIGTAVSSQGWEITVSDVTTYQRVGDYTANGTFLYVSLSIKNTGANPAAFPFDGLIVVDANGVSYVIDVPATKESLTYDKNVDMFAQFEAGSSHDVAAVFDVASDATGLKLTTPSNVFSIVLDYTVSPK